MDVEYQPLPPVALTDESDEDRKQRLIARVGGMSAIPPPKPVQPSSGPSAPQPLPPIPAANSPRLEANTAIPLGQPDKEGWRRGVSPASDANASHPALPPVKPPEINRPGDVTPGIGRARAEAEGTEPNFPALPSVPATAPNLSGSPTVQPGAMPAVPIGPQQKAYEDLSAKGEPKLTGWKNVLDKIGQFLPFGKAIEREIGGTPQNYDAKLNQAALRAAKEQALTKGRQETQKGAQGEKIDEYNNPIGRRVEVWRRPDGTIEKQVIPDAELDAKDEAERQAKYATQATANEEKLAKMPVKPGEKVEHYFDDGTALIRAHDGSTRIAQLEQGGKAAPHDVVKQYSDALAAGDEKKAAELLPRVKQFIENTRKPAKEPAETEKAKDIADYLEANKLPDNAANREKARGAIAQRSKTEVSGTDAKDIAQAIMRGDQPPTTTGLYRNAAAVRAELARAGFNLAQAESDWHATQKHLGTLNGAQQERLRQAVSFTSDSLGIIEGLYDQWQKTGKTSQWKVFNKASLATAKQLPGEAGNLAHRLEAQISDLTSELGTVYKGGNSSTDESLKLAAKNLEADWNEKTFKDAIGQIRTNLEIRQNSIRHSQPAGVSPNSRYTPENEKPAASGGKVWNPQTGKYE